MLEHGPVAVERERVEHRRERRVDLVLEEEDVPPDLALLEIEHAGIEAAEDVCEDVGGRCRVAHGSLERRGEVVAIQRVGWFAERGTATRGGQSPTAREGREADSPELLHENLDKVALAEHEVVLERAQVVH